MEILAGNRILFELCRMGKLPLKERPALTVECKESSLRKYTLFKLDNFAILLDEEQHLIGMRVSFVRQGAAKFNASWYPQGSEHIYSSRYLRSITIPEPYRRPALGAERFNELCSWLGEPLDRPIIQSEASLDAELDSK